MNVISSKNGKKLLLTFEDLLSASVSTVQSSPLCVSTSIAFLGDGYEGMKTGITQKGEMIFRKA
jgi:hypothetical protein